MIYEERGMHGFNMLQKDKCRFTSTSPLSVRSLLEQLESFESFI